MKKFLSGDGFTLIELMVVVAIIGILSSIAVPNFRKYQAKSKQTEAKIQLAAVYTTEVGALADYDTYATCLTDLGYEVSPKGYYIVGFSAAAAAPNALVVARGATCVDAGTFAIAPTVHQRANAAIALPVAGDIASVAPTSTNFTAASAGNISTTGASTLDKWRINEAKSLTNSTQGF